MSETAHFGKVYTLFFELNLIHLPMATKRMAAATPIAARPTAPLNSDRISFLPQPILHHILSSLETKDVIRTSILSHRFYSTFISFPILDLDAKLSHDSSNIGVDRENRLIELAQDFFDIAVRTIERRQGSETDLQRLRLRVPVSEAGQYLDHVSELTNFALTRRVKDLDIDLQEFTDEYLLSLTGPPLDAYFESVETLRLSNLRLNDCEDMRKFLGLKDLVMKRCSKFEHLKVSSNHIRSIKLIDCVDMNKIEINAPSLQEFVFKAFKRRTGEMSPCKVDISDCKSLQFLSISNVSSNWVDKIVPELLHLEKLIISQCIKFANFGVSNETLKTLELVNCYPLRNIVILRRQLPSLETVKLESCSALEVLKIEHDGVCSLEVTSCRVLLKLHVDTPQLVTFVYKGQTCHFSVFNSRAILEAKLSIDSTRWQHDYIYFSELRDMVGHFGHGAVLTLACRLSEYLIFPVEVRWERGPTLCDLKHLKVQCERWQAISTDLVDSLIWLSPQLETLSLLLDNGKEKLLTFQHNGAIGQDEEDQWCFYGKIVKSWKNSVKRVEIKSFDRIDADNLENYFRKNAKLAVTVAREDD